MAAAVAGEELCGSDTAKSRESWPGRAVASDWTGKTREEEHGREARTPHGGNSVIEVTTAPLRDVRGRRDCCSLHRADPEQTSRMPGVKPYPPASRARAHGELKQVCIRFIAGYSQLTLRDTDTRIGTAPTLVQS